MPLIESARRQQTALCTLPWSPPAWIAAELLDGGVDRGIFRGSTVAEVRNQPPAHQQAFAAAVDCPHHRHRIARRHVEAALVLAPQREVDRQITFGLCDFGSDVTATHGPIIAYGALLKRAP